MLPILLAVMLMFSRHQFGHRGFRGWGCRHHQMNPYVVARAVPKGPVACAPIGHDMAAFVYAPGQVSLVLPSAFACGSQVVRVSKKAEVLGLGTVEESTLNVHGAHLVLRPVDATGSMRIAVAGSIGDDPKQLEVRIDGVEDVSQGRHLWTTVWIR